MTRKGNVSRAQRYGIFVVLIAFFFLMTASLVYAQEQTYEKALRAYLKKDYGSAVKYLKQYVAEKPEASAYYLLGYANYKLKHRKEAMQYFKEAYLVDPDFSPTAIDFKDIKK